MTIVDLPQLTRDWDRAYAASLPPLAAPSETRPYARLLDNMQGVVQLRFQPYQNDALQDYVSKLQRWLSRVPVPYQPAAFLLAAKIVFITQKQFESLQKQLFVGPIRRLLLDFAIERNKLPPLHYDAASRYLESEMNQTLFIGNSNSSAINAFAHVNADYFSDRARRRLVGPDAQFWTYPQARLKTGLASDAARTAVDYEALVLKTDPHLAGKTCLVILEDFAGSGSDLTNTLQLLQTAALPLQHIVLAPVMTTAIAKERLTAACASASSPQCTYSFFNAFELPHRFRCFDTSISPPSPEASYLDGQSPILDLSKKIEELSDILYKQHFSAPIPHSDRHGFGGLALAFAFYSNCPDNALPFIWKQTPDWTPLFRRASNYL